MYFVNEFKRKNRGFSFSTLNNNEPNFPFLLSQVESLGNRLWDTHGEADQNMFSEATPVLG